MAKTDWKFNDIVTEMDMNELGQEVNDQAAAVGDMATVPTEAKDAAGAIAELHAEKLDQAGGKMTGALFVETAAREISAGSWADMSANNTGYALFAQNCYTANSNEYRYSNTHASLGARGIRFNQLTASVEYFDTGAIATTRDLAFTPNWINMRPDAAATANRTILRDASGRGKVAAPVAADDIARLDTVQSFGYGTTGGTGSAYTLAIGLVTALTEGLRITIKLHAANGASPTLNINGLGAKAILKSSGSAPAAGLLKAGSIYTLVYNGSAFTLQGEGGEYGTAVATEVLAGKTIGTEAGLVSGAMPLRGGEEHAGWVRAEMGTNAPYNGRIHLRSPLGAYLNGGGNGVGYMGIFADDPNFITANIRAGKEVFGLIGIMEEGYRVIAGSVISSPSAILFPYGSSNQSLNYIELSGFNMSEIVLVFCQANDNSGVTSLYSPSTTPTANVGNDFYTAAPYFSAGNKYWTRANTARPTTQNYICLPTFAVGVAHKYIIIGR